MSADHQAETKPAPDEGILAPDDIDQRLPPIDERPLVTFAVFAYNQEKYIRDAVEGAFSQTYHPLEIILSDDCSTDRTFEIIQEMAAAYQGPHRVRLRRSAQNLGLTHHINEVTGLINARIVVVAAGDDISEHRRVEVLANLFEKNYNITAVFSDFSTIPGGEDSSTYGVRNPEISLTEIIISGGGIQKGATYAFRRDCLSWPSALPDWLRSEDRILPLRAALLGVVRYVPQKLVRYRLRVPSRRTVALPKPLYGYNNPRHFQLLKQHIGIAYQQGKIDSRTAHLMLLMVKWLQIVVWLRSKTGILPGISRIMFLPLRIVRKIAVLRVAWGARQGY